VIPTVGADRLGPVQVRALAAAWLGWAFDGLDGYLYIIVSLPFVRELVTAGRGLTPELLRASPELARSVQDDVTTKAAIIQSVFLVGWAVGGAVFGRIGDRLGRSRTLTLTILTYAVFTGMAFFAQAWWHLLIFRFIAALGIGGEWAAGSALVCETLPRRHRVWASAALQSGYMVGCILATLTAGWMAGLPSTRWVFLVGVAPAFITFWIRRAVPEPAEWAAQIGRRKPPPLRALFSRGLLRTTLMTIAITGIALTTVWCFLFFVPQAIRRMPDVAAWEPPRVQHLVTNVTVFFLLVNIGGNFLATYLAKLLGYRRAFALLFALSLVCFVGFFRSPLSLSNVYWITGFAGLIPRGLFGLVPGSGPLLVPTLMRTLGAGFTYNAGRLISAVGTFFGGVIAASAGGPHMAVWWVGLLYIPAIALALVCPLPIDERSEAGA